MANFILLYARISLLLIFLDIIGIVALPVENQQIDKSVLPTDNNHSDNNIHAYFHGNWSKQEHTIQINDTFLYKQRSKTAAVLISIYFGIFGVDWFYLSRGNIGYIIVGIFKLLVSFGCCTGWPILTFGIRRSSSSMIMISYTTSILLSLISLIWWVIDWIRILVNKFPDGNGNELKHFSEYF